VAPNVSVQRPAQAGEARRSGSAELMVRHRPAKPKDDGTDRGPGAEPTHWPSDARRAPDINILAVSLAQRLAAALPELLVRSPLKRDEAKAADDLTITGPVHCADESTHMAMALTSHTGPNV